MILYAIFAVLSLSFLYYSNQKWIEDIRHCSDRMKRTPTCLRDYFQQGFNQGRLEILTHQPDLFKRIILTFLRCVSIGRLNTTTPPPDNKMCRQKTIESFASTLFKTEQQQQPFIRDAGRYLGIYSERNDPKNGKEFFNSFVGECVGDWLKVALENAKKLDKI